MTSAGSENGEFPLNISSKPVERRELDALDMAGLLAEREQLLDKIEQLTALIEAYPGLIGELFEQGIDLLPSKVEEALKRRLGSNPFLSDAQLRRMAAFVTQNNPGSYSI